MSDISIFSKRETTLADLKKAGWYRYHSSSGKSWWINTSAGTCNPKFGFAPLWLDEMLREAYANGQASVRAMLSAAIGDGTKENKRLLRHARPYYKKNRRDARCHS